MCFDRHRSSINNEATKLFRNSTDKKSGTFNRRPTLRTTTSTRCNWTWATTSRLAGCTWQRLFPCWSERSSPRMPVFTDVCGLCGSLSVISTGLGQVLRRRLRSWWRTIRRRLPLTMTRKSSTSEAQRNRTSLTTTDWSVSLFDFSNLIQFPKLLIVQLAFFQSCSKMQIEPTTKVEILRLTKNFFKNITKILPQN